VVAAGDAKPVAAWYSPELYIPSPAVDVFERTMIDAPTFKWIQIAGAGADKSAFQAVLAKGGRLTSNHGHTTAMAEYVMATVLDYYQCGAARRAAQAERTWRVISFREIRETTWLLVGFGAIGQAVAERARPFGVKILAVRRDQSPHPLADKMASLSDLPKLLPQADVTILCLPLRPETQNMVDAKFLSAMKDGSVLVNVGRGGLADEAALLAALDSGKPAHAILDVFQTEPLPADSRFWSHPRVVMTSHTSSVTDNIFPKADSIFIENLRRFVGGEELLNEVTRNDVS
jgi:phosphoglycerate dehydrogenase-like enzyme